jgi:hypothetical protein
MKNLFTFKHSFELLAAVIAVGALLAVLQTFVIGKHFVIPTAILAVAIFFGNLARHGLRGSLLAKQTLFWLFFLATCHAFFALFWAKTPREILGDAFLPVYGATFVILAVLCWQYARHNAVLK